MSAAANLVRYPWIEEFRLVDVVSSGPFQPIPETTESTDSEDIRLYFYELGCAKFLKLSRVVIVLTLSWV